MNDMIQTQHQLNMKLAQETNEIITHNETRRNGTDRQLDYILVTKEAHHI